MSSSDGRVVYVLLPGQGTRLASDAAAPLTSSRVASCALDELKVDITRLTAAQLAQSTYYGQLALGVRLLDLLDRLRREQGELLTGSEATYFAGFSLGEVPALAGAGRLSLRDTLKVLKARAEAMQKACEARPGSMVTLLGVQDETKIEQQNGVSIAIRLFPGCRVAAGPAEAMRGVKWVPEIAEKAQSREELVGAFHTELMQDGAEAIRQLKGKVKPAKGRKNVDVFSNATGMLYTEEDDVLNTLAKQVECTVQWETILQTIVDDERPKVIIDLGSKGQFRAMLRRMVPSVSKRGQETAEDAEPAESGEQIEIVEFN
mmetsp:Transcript_16357/g.31785  ORF Transcript_16357/g.31785 Transcript_16357/m.31785 type:complete len:318 (+) Transcript_16357:69-1022(+)|eukprot:CAMPEP_0171516826 /NCGR_PEP_ID=MMETSP0959-20130129/4273_1 /TAXON_ID=87120 /ORGANISM="Aurantiochytrium limacinum, Strain ATCCMYA-1381" /LENGTH=317 /DNA_ID=CAMNT_0012055621 /DNA_START=69 /DNA_END=1022 /DNA_ORIENTATION=-